MRGNTVPARYWGTRGQGRAGRSGEKEGDGDGDGGVGG